jgi:tRNA pseudouridine synthase 10
MGTRHLPSGEICDYCHGTDQYYQISIEDYICPPILDATQGIRAIFHAAGREDYDTRCLGKGRPFIVEIVSPLFPNIDLDHITNQINFNANKHVIITPLEWTTGEQIAPLKANTEFDQKRYHSLISWNTPLTREKFQPIELLIHQTFTNLSINQHTPTRILSRKTDKMRKKQIYSVSGTYQDPLHGLFIIIAQGGTYIKELISGDQGRTLPSLADFFSMPTICVELDVIFD